MGITSDAYGNSYLTGHFSSPTITFGNITLTNSDNINQTSDIFMTKYDPNGNVIWAKRFGVSNNGEVGSQISVDKSGNIYITGNYGQYTVFGSFGLNNNSGSNGNNNMFVTKCDSGGNVIWAKGVFGEDPIAQSIIVNAIGELYIVGYFSSYINLDNIVLATGAINYTSDMFIAKYNTYGKVIWAKNYGGTDGADVSYDICLDASYNFYITGWFESKNINFNGIKITNTDTVSTLTRDIFVVKFDSTCTALWAINTGTLDHEAGFGICSDTNNNLYVTGFFAGSGITFGNDVLFNFGSYTSEDIYIAKLSSQSATNISTKFPVKTNIFVYPNPFTSQTTISFNKEIKNATIKITDVLGKEVRSINFSGKEIIIEKGELKAGIYFMQVISENEMIANEKIVIQ
jgi:hypothetical protein